MTSRGYYIISLDARELYKEILKADKDIGYAIPGKKDLPKSKLFKNVLDYSLDLKELESAYEKVCRKHFHFEDERQNKYTLAIINVKFDANYKEEAKNGKLKIIKDRKALREYWMVCMMIFRNKLFMSVHL